MQQLMCRWKRDEKVKVQDDVTFKYDGKVKEAAILCLIILLIMLSPFMKCMEF